MSDWLKSLLLGIVILALDAPNQFACILEQRDKTPLVSLPQRHRRSVQKKNNDEFLYYHQGKKRATIKV